MKYFGKVNNSGQLHIIHRKQFDKELELLAGKEVEVLIRKKRRYRSLPQNNYYWGVIVPMVQEALINTWGEKNISKEQVHEILKRECNKKELINEETGEFLTYGKDTHDLSTTEFNEYIEKCRQWSSMWLNIDIPEPDEQTMLNFES